MMEEMEDSTLILSFKWTAEYTSTLIKLRHEKRDYFTGKRNTAKAGWEYVLKEMGLDGIVSVKQAKKKWDNLVHKYKELKSARIGTSEGEIAATSWPFYQLLEDALTNGPLVTLPVVISSITEQEEHNDQDDHGQEVDCDVGIETSMPSLPHVQYLDARQSGASSYATTALDAPARKKRKRESEDAYLGLFQQSRQDWIRMHNTFERQGERMLALLADLVKCVKKN